MARGMASRRGALALVAILVGAATLRAWGVWSGELIWHPDESFMVIYPLNLFSGDLNPHVFYYPSLHYYELGLLYALDFLLQSLTSDVGLFDWIASRYFIDAVPLRDLARWLSIAYALGTVVLAGVLGGRLAAQQGPREVHHAQPVLLGLQPAAAGRTIRGGWGGASEELACRRLAKGQRVGA